MFTLISVEKCKTISVENKPAIIFDIFFCSSIHPVFYPKTDIMSLKMEDMYMV